MKKLQWLCMLIIILAVASLTGSAMAESSGTCGENLTWLLDDEGTLTISGNGAMFDYEYNYMESTTAPWYAYFSEIKKVLINNNVTNIGNCAFASCSNLTFISIPESVTSIGSDAFNSCSNLTNVTIPNGVMSIGFRAFEECSSLESVMIPNSVMSIGFYAFYKCSSLASITIPDSVTSIEDSAFGDCSLANIYVDSLTQWLSYDHGLSDLHLQVEGNLYISNTILTDLSIPANVTSISERAFWNCSSIINVKIPNSITSIGERAFCNCSSLTSVEIPNSITSIGDCAFASCNSLSRITIPSNVTHMGDSVFSQCGNLTSVTILHGITSIGDCAFYGCSSLTSVTIPNSVTSIGDYAFKACSRLTSIMIPDTVTSIGNQAFYNCSNLTRITIPDSVISIGDSAFCYCSGLTSATLSNSVTSIGNSLFCWCSNLKNIVIPSSVTSIGSRAFYDCNSLASVSILGSVTSIGSYAFYACEKLENVYYDREYRQHGDISIGNYNTPLTKATWHYRPHGACGDNSTYELDEAGLLTITGTGAMNAHYPSSSFPWKPSLVKQVNIAEGITELPDYAFYFSDVTAVYMPDSLLTFGTNLFSSTPLVYCNEYSNADYWAYSNGLEVVYIDSGSFGNYGSIKAYVDNNDDTATTSASLYRGKTQQLSASVFPMIAGQPVTWSSSDESVVTVDQNGLVTAIARGTATITASIGNLSSSVTLTVQGFGDVGTLKLTAPEMLQVGNSVLLTPTAAPADDMLVYKWSSSDKSILTVSEEGLVKAVGTGTATVTVEADGATASAEIYSYIPATSISAEKSEYWGIAKSTVQITCNVVPADANPKLVWTSEHSAHAAVTVSEDDIVGCFVPGDITLTATDEITGLSFSTIVHVCRPVTSIEMDATTTIPMDFPYQVQANAYTADGSYGNHLLTFTSGDNSIATITAEGLLTPVASGTVQITASAESGVTAVCSVTVTDNSTLVLPSALTVIESEAFCGTAAQVIIIPVSVTSVAPDAFDNCPNLKYIINHSAASVTPPEGVEVIAEAVS